MIIYLDLDDEENPVDCETDKNPGKCGINVDHGDESWWMELTVHQAEELRKLLDAFVVKNKNGGSPEGH